jgi:acetolactate synthase small subunit
VASKKTKELLKIALKDNKAAEEVAASVGLVAAAVADIPTPATATAEDCANKINALLASLRAAGILAA